MTSVRRLAATHTLPPLPPPPGAPPPSVVDQKLDVLTDTVARKGNAVRVLFSGRKGYLQRLQMIDAAEKSICLQTFAFNACDTGWELARHLVAKVKQGIPVRVIYDDLGSETAEDKALLRYLRLNGVQLQGLHGTHVWQRLNHRWHEKSLVIDGKIAIQGGMNVSDCYTGPPSRKTPIWRDTDIVVEGEAAADAQWDFVRNWYTAGGAIDMRGMVPLFPHGVPQKGSTSVRIIQNRPHDDHTDDVEDGYAVLIEEAKTSITIETPYLLATPRLQKALLDAAKRGVKIRIVTNSAKTTDEKPVGILQPYYYSAYLKAGIEIYEMTYRTVHAKTMSVDGKWALVGSANFNHRSMRLDSETIVIAEDATAAKDLERHAENLSRFEAQQVTPATLAKRSWFDLFLAWLLHFFVRFM